MDLHTMCEHLQQLIDQHEGSVVCTDCGYVLDIHFLQQSDTYEKSSLNLVTDLKMYLIDCCDRMHIPISVREEIHDEYEHFRSKSVFEKISDIQLMAYSIYFILKNQGIGRNIEYIAYNTGVTSKQLWKCESLDPYLSIPINIESLLGPVYKSFKFSRKDYETIIIISKHFQDRHFSPLTLTSTLVYLYCKTRKIQISVKKVCSVFKVSSMSIYRCKLYILSNKFHCILENILHDKK